jgi:Ca2+-binding RTX toxin-like protein
MGFKFASIAIDHLQQLEPLGYYIEGTQGNDTLYGSGGADALYGLGGNDYLSAGDGNDTLDGGDGNDTLVGGRGADSLNGGAGFDTASYAASSAGVQINLSWNQGLGGDAQGDTYTSIEKLVGSSHNDILIADTDYGVSIDGGAGNDGIRGGNGLDVLNGGSGDDWLTGGKGIDVLTGGSGADVFLFNWGDGPDLVTDFTPGVDKIALGEGFFEPGGFRPTFGGDGELRSGTDVSAALRSVGHRGGDTLFWDTDDHQLYQITNGSYHHPATASLLATFSNDIQLHTSDFIFV